MQGEGVDGVLAIVLFPLPSGRDGVSFPVCVDDLWLSAHIFGVVVGYRRVVPTRFGVNNGVVPPSSGS